MANQTTSQVHSADAFLDTLIDYAGLFPPAKLPLDQAIKNYAAYSNDRDAWMIGPFVMPVKDIEQLDDYMNLFTTERPMNISALGRKGDDENTSLSYAKEDVIKVEDFREKYGEKVQINFFEVAIPSLTVGKKYLKQLNELMSEHQLQCYAELPIQENTLNWDVQLESILHKISTVNNEVAHPLGVKLRSGGITADLIPSAEVVGSFIYNCNKYNIPCKFTAGLHHPIRMYRQEVEAEMHGFVNVFTAGMLSNIHNLEIDKIIEILNDKSPSNFSFTDKALAWKNLKISSTDVQSLRKEHFCSYGSCSFDEPREELRSLDIIERG